MRSYIVLGAVLLAVIAAGCSPVGMDDTRCFVRGRIYTDNTRTTGMENVGVFTLGTQETYTAMTNANGDFFIEIQLYPEQVTEQGEYGITGSVSFGLQATFGLQFYPYGIDDEFTFTVFGGDTLTMYDIDMTMFKPVS
ncbi:MAG: hypothetical protein JXA64_08125 [Candidatus Fermentibacteraceae bacterium]|nr:hypothetical protein [Candidatus Fermentibacteraceae bacterium]MBN2609066.1 hypothetical protein [Candidatus Fermentibacteraceae bacterium]